MKIQKFGIIKFTEQGFPKPSHFDFEANPFEIKACEDAKIKALLMFTAIRDHLNESIKQIQQDIDNAYLSDSGDFSVPVGTNSKSPKQIVSESLSRIRANL